ncbi:hypothetical protein BBR47_44060 [Brevibacillus brevis NBRC 100599]|uniref:Uncharacterized protein n=1 Tax=Brevibacillus brevis (strain 47 / JCM 6285 / NBRC 100599) TaxID=358681 RepID=C0ZJ08_BREBN|nr:hypothetical protein BBR47_44060 [Brevibacillus brevis NBRC 100599]
MEKPVHHGEGNETLGKNDYIPKKSGIAIGSICLYSM